MSRIDFDARAANLEGRIYRAHPTQRRAIILDALRAVALEAGDLVHRAHRERRSVYDCDSCGGRGDHPGYCRCTDCGGTGVADAAIVLGLTRPR